MNKSANTADSERYAIGAATVSLVLADNIRDQEPENSERRKKMDRVIVEKQQLYETAVAQYAKTTSDRSFDPSYPTLSLNAVKKWDAEQKCTLLIDAYFSNPFLPYELSYSTKVFEKKVFEKAWSDLGDKLDVKESLLKEIRDSTKAAKSAHRHIDWLKIGLGGTGFAALVAVGGLFVAPVLGGMLGGAAGLSGAAAVSHGLALLGGGSLAAGGAGMAGGMWLVTAAAAGTAGLFATTAQVAFSMGKQQFMTEVVKLQVSLKVRVAEQQMSVAVAQSKIGELQEQRKKLEEILEEERQLNDKNSQRLKDLEAKVQAVTDALKWLGKEVA